MINNYNYNLDLYNFSSIYKDFIRLMDFRILCDMRDIEIPKYLLPVTKSNDLINKMLSYGNRICR
jgi:hypothetical protein